MKRKESVRAGCSGLRVTGCQEFSRHGGCESCRSVRLPSTTCHHGPLPQCFRDHGKGQATKIIFPFEVSQLIKQGAKFLGASDESLEAPSKIVLDESILGNIPRREDVDAILKEIQDAVPKVSEDEPEDTSKRRLPLDKEKDDPVPGPAGN